MIADEGCAERGCPMHDGTPGVQMVEKEWVGLTDEEAEQLIDEHWEDLLMLMEAIEAKLKEKNSAT